MKMLAAAGEVVVWLGHEGGLDAVAVAGAFHHALEDRGFVGRAQGIGAMDQAHFELSRRIFRYRRFERQTGRLAETIEVVMNGRKSSSSRRP